jgi:recombinational DNA repair ATPase RecF
MGMSSEMRRLENKWNTREIGNTWPKFLDSIDINGLRGWRGQRIEFPFPIVAIVGENGSGKSTILQAAPIQRRLGSLLASPLVVVLRSSPDRQ